MEDVSTLTLGEIIDRTSRISTELGAELIEVLGKLTQKTCSRSATVTGAGKPLVLTVYSYAERMASHERAHVKQINRIAAALQQ